jgi:uncharacterized protein YdaU (DUF1376 family)
MSRPWMPLYVADYLADTGHLTVEESGAYLHLIMAYWQRGGLPNDDGQLAIICRMSAGKFRKIRSKLASFFAPGWKHKRIDAELQKTQRISIQRSSAASIRWSNGSANASANAEQVQTQPQPQPQSHSFSDEKERGANAPADLSEEDRFWSRLERLERKGIGRSRCIQLLKLVSNDFTAANDILDRAEDAEKPSRYLGGVIRNLKAEAAGEGNGVALGSPHPDIPQWVQVRRAAGVLVERDGKNWRCQGDILNDAGEEIGF